MRRLIPLIGFCIPVMAMATYSQSPVNTVHINPIAVVNESGADSNLEKEITGNKSLILVPAYFNCNSTCPLLAENLRDAISKAKLGNEAQVIFLSFNPNDGLKDSQMFRHHHKLPADWKLLIVKKESEAKSLLDPFGYQFQKIPDGFDHPNSALVLSGEKRFWTGILAGVENTPDEIDRAIGEAKYADLDGLGQRLVQYASKPEYLIALGFVGVVIPLLLIIFVLYRRNRRFSEVLPS